MAHARARRSAPGLLEHRLEQNPRARVFGGVAQLVDCSAEVLTVEMVRVATHDADGVEHVLVRPASTLNTIKSSGVGIGTSRSKSRRRTARARARPSKGTDATTMSS